MTLEEDIEAMERELDQVCGLGGEQRREHYGCMDCSDLRAAADRFKAEKQRRDEAYELYLQEEYGFALYCALLDLMKNAHERLSVPKLERFSEAVEALCDLSGVKSETATPS